MRKKLWLGLTALVLVLAISTTAFAMEHNGIFEQMQSQMKQIHPDFSDEQIQDMYQNCHSDDGSMQHMNQKGIGNMMNNRTS